MSLPHLSVPRSLTSVHPPSANLCVTGAVPTHHSWALTVVWWLQLPHGCWCQAPPDTQHSLSFSTPPCQCPTLGTSCFPQAPTLPHASPSLFISMYLQALMSAPLSQPLLFRFSGSPPLCLAAKGSRSLPCGWRLGEPRGGISFCCSFWTQAGSAGRGRAEYHRASLSVGGTRRGLSPTSPPSQPQFSFSSLPPPPSPSPVYTPQILNRLLSWVLSHHTQTHSLPQVSLPPASHRARPTEPPAALG